MNDQAKNIDIETVVTCLEDDAARMLELLSKFDLHALAFTNDGQPRHPLYLKGSSKPMLWRAA